MGKTYFIQHDLIWSKNRRDTGAFFIGQACSYLIFKLFRVVHFNLPQGWESRKETTGLSGNIIIMKPDPWCNILVEFLL